MVLQRENVLSSKEYSAGVEQHPWSSLGALIRLMPVLGRRPLSL